MKPCRDITGQTFGRLTAIKIDGHIQAADGNWKTIWLARCSCGTEIKVPLWHLLSGNTKSCGCLKTDVLTAIRTTHGGCKSRLYRVWAHMVERCTNPESKSFKHYGARGICICDEWRCDFAKFQAWAALTGYDENAPKMQCTIERIDNDAGYSPDNCRWATQKEQCQNRRPKGKNVNPKPGKKVYCLELNTVFDSVKEAREQTGAALRGIRKCCNKYPSQEAPGGYHWDWAEFPTKQKDQEGAGL